MRQRQTKRRLQEELSEQSDAIAQQLTLWDIPAYVLERHRVDLLQVRYDARGATRSVAAGTAERTREDYQLRLRVDGREHKFEASRWTGESWECANFYRLDGDTYGDLADSALWYQVMIENADSGAAAAAASIATMGFCDIEFGSGDIVNLITVV